MQLVPFLEQLRDFQQRSDSGPAAHENYSSIFERREWCAIGSTQLKCAAERKLRQVFREFAYGLYHDASFLSGKHRERFFTNSEKEEEKIFSCQFTRLSRSWQP